MAPDQTFKVEFTLTREELHIAEALIQRGEIELAAPGVLGDLAFHRAVLVSKKLRDALDRAEAARYPQRKAA